MIECVRVGKIDGKTKCDIGLTFEEDLKGGV